MFRKIEKEYKVLEINFAFIFYEPLLLEKNIFPFLDLRILILFLIFIYFSLQFIKLLMCNI